MVKYKIYELVQTRELKERVENFVSIPTFVVDESQLNDSGCGFDSFEEALAKIESTGYKYINYTILPYIYKTDI